MTPLYRFRARLTWLRRALTLLRWGATVSALLAIAGLGLMVIFAVDWTFRLAVPERLVVMLLAMIGGVWAYFRFGRPRMLRTKNELEAALFVERQHEIDSDLVAALQFASFANDAQSSPRLAGAVVDYVVAATPQINVFQGVHPRPFVQRLTVLLVVAAIVAAVAVSLPSHVAAFGQRLLLSSQPYPSRTHVVQLTVGEGVVFEAGEGILDVRVAKAAEGQPLVFQLVCSGLAPPVASVQLRPAGKWGAGTRIELHPDPVSLGGRQGHVVLTGQLPRFVEPATYSLSAGDAARIQGDIEMIPLPIVELRLKVEPPAYAAVTPTTDRPAPSSVILEGSSVRFAVQCTNQKSLKSVSVNSIGGSQRIACVPEDEGRQHWSTPCNLAELSDLRQELRYEVEVVDDDGLSPQLPLRGVVRVRPDEPPTAAIELVHRVVLPTAKPQVIYRAGDDYGVAGLEMVVEIERGAPADAPSESEEPMPVAERPRPDDSARAVPLETRRLAIPFGDSLALGDDLPLAGAYRLDLGPMALAPGDRLRLMVEAIDYRGDRDAGKSVSEARILEVGDEKAVLAAIREADQRSETQLNDLIRSELSIGKQP